MKFAEKPAGRAGLCSHGTALLYPRIVYLFMVFVNLRFRINLF